MKINIGTSSAKYKQHIPTPRILYKMCLNPGPITKSKSCPKHWCRYKIGGSSPKMQGQHHFTTKSLCPLPTCFWIPKKAVPKKTVYTGGRRLVRGYVCKIMSIIYIKLLCSYLHWHIHQSISISSLQLTKAVIFSKRRFASARADRRHTAAIRPIFWWQVCQQV